MVDSNDDTKEEYTILDLDIEALDFVIGDALTAKPNDSSAPAAQKQSITLEQEVNTTIGNREEELPFGEKKLKISPSSPQLKSAKSYHNLLSKLEAGYRSSITGLEDQNRVVASRMQRLSRPQIGSIPIDSTTDETTEKEDYDQHIDIATKKVGAFINEERRKYAPQDKPSKREAKAASEPQIPQSKLTPYELQRTLAVENYKKELFLIHYTSLALASGVPPNMVQAKLCNLFMQASNRGSAIPVLPVAALSLQQHTITGDSLKQPDISRLSRYQDTQRAKRKGASGDSQQTPRKQSKQKRLLL